MAEKSSRCEEKVPANHGDKGKKREKRPFIVNREAYERVNYLYQAAHITLAEDPENLELSRHYVSTAKRITEKLVLKIDSKMKKLICKCCHNLLLPGITAKHRIRGKRESHLVITCMTCGTVKRQRTNTNYKEERGSIDNSDGNDDVMLTDCVLRDDDVKASTSTT